MAAPREGDAYGRRLAGAAESFVGRAAPLALPSPLWGQPPSAVRASAARLSPLPLPSVIPSDCASSLRDKQESRDPALVSWAPSPANALRRALCWTALSR